MTIITNCYAKINLFLSVSSPDEFIYHPIRTIFQTIDLHDKLLVSDSAQDEIICNWTELPQKNTLTKTLSLIRELVPVPKLKIELEKNIPSEAGLGGGSSNSAALLRCIKKAFGDMVDDDILLEVATAVGADVPFFLTGGTAQGTGYGNIITPLPDLPPCSIILIKPSVSTSTAQAYSELDYMQREEAGFPDLSPFPNLSTLNDFELVMPSECAEIKEQLLNEGASIALLSGSGSCVFGLFDSEVIATQVAKKLRRQSSNFIYSGRTISRQESIWTTL